MPMIVPLRPRGTVKLSLTFTTLSNRRCCASRSGTTPCCCSNGCRRKHVHVWENVAPKRTGLKCRDAHSEEEVRLHRHAHFLGAFLHLQRRTCERRKHETGASRLHASITLTFSTASSIFSTMAASSTCSSQDVLVAELTGWLFSHDVISATFSALCVGH